MKIASKCALRSFAGSNATPLINVRSCETALRRREAWPEVDLGRSHRFLAQHFKLRAFPKANIWASTH